LRKRITATKWPEREQVADASQGVQLATMQKLAQYWANSHDWRKCEAKINSLGDSARSVATDVARDFPSARGVTYESDILEIESFDHCRKVVGIAVHVIAGRGLAGSPVAAPVMRPM